MAVDMRSLKEKVARLQREVVMWRERALRMQEMLRAYGIQFLFD
jgi:molecular chaperone GrpE (heat shock protein)